MKMSTFKVAGVRYFASDNGQRTIIMDEANGFYGAWHTGIRGFKAALAIDDEMAHSIGTVVSVDMVTG